MNAPRLVETERLVLSVPVLDAAGDVMTGYVLAKDAWGRGLATEALRAMVELARDVGAARIYALCHPEHLASQRVLAKCTFVRDQAWTQQTVFPNLAPEAQDTLGYERVTRLSGRDTRL